MNIRRYTTKDGHLAGYFIEANHPEDQKFFQELERLIRVMTCCPNDNPCEVHKGREEKKPQ